MLYTPLSLVIPDKYWPASLFGSKQDSFLNNLACLAYEDRGSEDYLSVYLRAKVLAEARLDLAFLKGMRFVLGKGDSAQSGLIDADLWIGSYDDRLDQEGDSSDGPPIFDLSISTSVLSLSVDRSLLRPARIDTVDGQQRVTILEGNVGIPLPVKLTMHYDDDWSLDLDLPAEQATSLSLPLCMIGETGVLVEASNLSLNFSGAGSRPQGAPESWRGLYLGNAKIYMPELFTGFVEASGLGIGSGGFYGQLAIDWSAAPRQANLGGVSLTLTRFALTFVQNALTSSSITGTLLLPFFERPIQVEITIGLDGSLHVRLSNPAGLETLQIDNVLTLTLKSLGFRYKDRALMTYLGGEIKPLSTAGGLTWPSFEVEELGIDSKGNISIGGGWIDLRDQKPLDLYSFQLEITRLGFGRTEDGRKWLGFNGGLKLVDGLTAGASVEGLRIYWNQSGFQGITLEGIGVELVIPDVLSFKGHVTMRDVPGGKRFDGDISLSLHSLGLEVTAQLVVGKQGSDRYFAIYLGVQLPAGIPLGSTGLALYGMEGLFAYQMEPNKPDDKQWFEDWYKQTPIGVTDLSSKWEYAPGSLALGAGVTIGTLNDNGFLFSGGVLLVIVFPGPIILLDGKANLMAPRAKLGQDAQFRSLGVLDAREGTILLGLDAEYRYEDDGELIDIAGSSEAYFNWRRLDWHIYLGQKDPIEKRMRAKVFDGILQADSYLMLDNQGVRMGARAGLYQNWKFGPLKVTAEAWVEGDAEISWSPAHFKGELKMHGALGLRVYGFGASMSVDASLAAEVFDPFHIRGDFRVRVNLPWPLPDFKTGVTLEWGPEKNFPALPLPLKEVAIEHPRVSTAWPLPRTTKQQEDTNQHGLLLPDYASDAGLYQEPSGPSVPTNAELAALPLVPPDCRPHITFSRPVHDDALIGVNPQVPAHEYERIGNPATNDGSVEVRYALKQVALERYTASAWVPVTGDLYGSWAPVLEPDRENTAHTTVAQTKLWLWSKSPFSYAQRSGAEWGDQVAGLLPSYPCSPMPPDRERCCYFEDYLDPIPSRWLEDSWECAEQGMTFSWIRALAAVADPRTVANLPPDDHSAALYFISLVVRGEISTPTSEVTISLKHPAKRVQLHYLIATNDDSLAEGRTRVTGFDALGRSYTAFVDLANRLITIDGENIVRVQILLYRTLWLTGVCATSGPNRSHYDLIGTFDRHTRGRLATWAQPGNVLEPYTKYRIKIVTNIEARGSGPLKGQNKSHTPVEYAYFQTGGPPGTTSYSRPLDHQGEFESGLSDLGAYIAQTLPASATDQGGRPLLARPVYRAYDVGVLFNEDYVDQMYRMARRNLGLYLYDNNRRPARDADGGLIATASSWGQAEVVTLSREEQRWITLISSSCQGINPNLPILRDSRLAPRGGHLLEPEAFYEARLMPLLLHESFQGLAAGTQITSTLNHWSNRLESGASGTSIWEVGSTGTPASFFIKQVGTVTATNSLRGGLLQYNFAETGWPAGNHSANWGDYRVSLYVRPAASSGSFGVIARYFSASSYLRYRMGDMLRRLELISGSSTTVLASVAVPLAFPFRANTDIEVQIECVGEEIRVYENRKLVLQGRDTRALTSRKGSIALYCSNNPGTRFSDIRVDDLRASAPAAYRFQFTTSRYANFFHQLHSFPGTLWSTELAARLSSAALTTAGNAAVTSITAAHNTAEKQQYEIVAKAVLGQTALQSPARVEVTRLLHGGVQVGLLLRSPEPLLWPRLQLTLISNSFAMARPILAGPAKIARVRFGLTGIPNAESFTILPLEDVSLHAARVEYRALNSTGAPGAWTALYTLSEPTPVRSGAPVTVYSGAADGTGRESLTPINRQRYRAANGTPGAISFSALGGIGVELRLLGPDGKLWHQQQFLYNPGTASVGHKLLRKADGTGLAILFTGALQTPRSMYLLTLTFRRSLGASSAEPVLREAGVDSSEMATLYLPFEAHTVP